MGDFLTTIQACREQAAAGALDGALGLLRTHLRAAPLDPFECDLAGQWLAGLEANSIPQPAFPIVRVAILADHTSTPLANAVRCALLYEGSFAVVYEGLFNTVFQEILDARSGLYREPRDLVLVALLHQHVGVPEQPLGTAAEAEAAATSVVGRWETAWAALRKNLRCPVLQHTVVPPGLAWLGAAERGLPASPDEFIGLVNRMGRAKAPGFVFWVETAALAQRVGLRNWHDPEMFYYGKFGFNSALMGDYIHTFLGAYRAATGRSRKCLVVDLDNTLWGGVVGDVGYAELKLGPGTPEGEAHADFCRYLKGLRARGVMLAICSKNNVAPAQEVFERHPHMPLQLADFSAICCNWENKAGNLRHLAQQLNIDLGHMAFVDDNPAERELIRHELPMVAVVELPADPAAYIASVDSLHLFDAAQLSQEDLLRTQSYRAREQAEDIKRTATNLDEYYTELAMVGRCYRVTHEADVARLAQMELKTNQFNLTTRRYASDQLQAFVNDPHMAVFACTLADRFADHGLVSSVIARIDGSDLVLDSWLMSCRVFSRTLEQFIMNTLCGFARANGLRRVVGEYLPTAKNSVVKELFATLGFQALELAGRPHWALDLAADTPPLQSFVRAGGS